MKIPSMVTFDCEVMRSYRMRKEFKYIAKGNVVIDDKDYDVKTSTLLAENANGVILYHI